MELEAVAEGYHATNPLAIGEGEQPERTDGINGSTRQLPPSRPPAPKRPPASSKPHLQSSFPPTAPEPPTQGYQSTVRQASYTVHEFENEVITKDNIDEMIYARRVKDNKMLTQVLIAASVVCFWWPFSLVCLAAAYYTSEKITELNDMKDYRTARSCRILNLVMGITAIVWAIVLLLIIVIAAAAS